MIECLNPSCRKEVPQTEGKRKRLYCSNSCRVKFHQKKNGGKVRWVSIEKYEKLKEELDALKAEKVSSSPAIAKILSEQTAIPTPDVKHKLWKKDDPKESSSAFYMKYGVMTYEEMENNN